MYLGHRVYLTSRDIYNGLGLEIFLRVLVILVDCGSVCLYIGGTVCVVLTTCFCASVLAHWC